MKTTQPPIQRAFVTLLRGKAEHSFPPDAKVKNAWTYSSISQYDMVSCLLHFFNTSRRAIVFGTFSEYNQQDATFLLFL